ncbi:MAG: hypothetical protein AAF556_02165, partial [Pseudomonadota bacterium]
MIDAPSVYAVRPQMLAELPNPSPSSLAERHIAAAEIGALDMRFITWRDGLVTDHARDMALLTGDNALVSGLNRLFAFSPYLSQGFIKAGADGLDLLNTPLAASLEAALQQCEQAAAQSTDFD